LNVNDFNVEIPEGDKLTIIFDHQRVLMNKYHPIEQKNVGQRVPSSKGKLGEHDGALDINDRACQLQLKSFAWRITEELTEASLCLMRDMTENDETHYLEEVIDALHFSVEICLMSGVDEGDDYSLTLEEYFTHSNNNPLNLYDVESQQLMRFTIYQAIERLGEAMNRLKLKPWKSTAILTDVLAYRRSIREYLQKFIDVCKASGFTADTAIAMYLNKNAVNQFRIRSNY
jgi:dimeric dUTPase (all-alpha-NTP-PPase superfamily)